MAGLLDIADKPVRGGLLKPPVPQPRTPGNLDPFNRPIYQRPDGKVYGTANTISVGTDEGETLIPTIIEGRQLTPEQAIQHYQQTGEHFGIFDSPDAADAYSQWLHEQMGAHVERDPTAAWKSPPSKTKGHAP